MLAILIIMTFKYHNMTILLKYCPSLATSLCTNVHLKSLLYTTTPTIPYYTINPSYCWMPDLENQEWCMCTIPYYTINPSYCWMPDLENQEWCMCTIPYYTINPSYCWMPDLENQEWCMCTIPYYTINPSYCWMPDLCTFACVFCI